MTAYLGTDFNDLSKLLFHCLSTTNPSFNNKTYLDEFETKKSNLDRVNFVYKSIRKYPNVFAKFTKDKKSDESASLHIESGKIKFNSGNYWGALEDYTRSAAAAESDRALALAYGQRAECFFELNIPQKCIQEIDRAVKLSYPKELIENLIEKRKQAEGLTLSTNNYFESIDFEVFRRNSVIQCADDCVEIKSNEELGRYIVATRDIEIGEILASEEPFTCVLTEDRFSHCHHCLVLCYNLLPCGNCTMALFCSESCKANAYSYHKYECTVLLTVCYRILCEFAIDDTMLLALKVALVAKDDYSQLDLLHARKDMYCSDKYREIHCLKSLATFSRFDIFHQAILTALIFDLLWNHTSFFSSIFANSDTEDKFKEVMMLQLQNSLTNSAKIYEYVQKYDFNGTNNYGCGAYAFFPLFTHSCCANVMKTYHGTTMVLRALNTIKKGDQCFVNRYGLRYDTTPKIARQQFLISHKLPKCTCKACEEDWGPNLGDVSQICQDLNIDVMPVGDIVRNIISANVTKANDFLKRLITLLKECESMEPSGNALALKHLVVHCYVVLGNKKLEVGSRVQRDFVLVP